MKIRSFIFSKFISLECTNVGTLTSPLQKEQQLLSLQASRETIGFERMRVVRSRISTTAVFKGGMLGAALLLCTSRLERVLALSGPSKVASSNSSRSLWNIFETAESPAQAFRTIFGEHGERGEYMDGYSETAMMDRCLEDYKWNQNDESNQQMDNLALERAAMMSHLYDNDELWKYVCLVAFAEHYVLTSDKQEENLLARPLETVLKHQSKRSSETPIFAGVVFRNWETCELLRSKLNDYKTAGIDYVRLECNLGNKGRDIGPPSKFLLETNNDQSIRTRLQRLALVAKECQNCELVPVVLLQVPWREEEPPNVSLEYFQEAVQGLVDQMIKYRVDNQKMLFETRPPMGISASKEASLSGPERVALGTNIGRTMLRTIGGALSSSSSNKEQPPTPFGGFCVAGGSTKGSNPTAMQDDTQNAVRQGMRNEAVALWGFPFCFWEMGAKLMLQPQVGELWGAGEREKARDLFCANAKALADEIQTSFSEDNET